MGVKFSKRFSAFILDAIFIGLISSIVSGIIPTSNNLKKAQEEVSNITQELIKQKIDEKEYVNKIAPYSYIIDKENFIINIVDVVVTIGYFVVFAFFYNGQTIGKKLLKIKVEKQKGELTINDMIFRAFIINGLLASIAGLIFIFTTKDMSYIIANTVMEYIQLGLMLVSVIMVLVRKDNLALQDIITKTRVVEVKE